MGRGPHLRPSGHPSVVGLRSGNRIRQTALTPDWRAQARSGVGRLDVEAEHHPALVVLGDVAVRHPAARVRAPVRRRRGPTMTSWASRS